VSLLFFEQRLQAPPLERFLGAGRDAICPMICGSGMAAVAGQDGDAVDEQQPSRRPYTHDALVTYQTAAQTSSGAIREVVHAVRFNLRLEKP
jgi:hypothetical protein